MSKFEKEYYKFEGFWHSENFNAVNAARIRQTYELLPADINSVLDAACGNGLFCNFLKQRGCGARVIGFDRSENALKYVEAEKIIGDISHAPFHNRKFDAVAALEILEHLPVPDFEPALSEICRIAKKYIIVSVPNNQTLENDMTRCPGCKSIFNPDLHLRSFTPKILRNLLQKYGFRVLEIKESGSMRRYFGYDIFLNIFRPKSRLAWRSPICPICGFQDGSYDIYTVNALWNTGNPILTLLRKTLKLFWPKNKKNYWLIALYGRDETGISAM